VIAVTFDVDFTDYLAGEPVDEIAATASLLQAALDRSPAIRTTWFVRIDAQVEALFGTADAILQRHAGFFDWLRERGHEVGWHHHAYRKGPDRWLPETDPARVRDQLPAASGLARIHGMSACRMGWGFHCNETMAELVRLGWEVDSSAVPRPRYEWDAAARDWARTPNHPYRPSVADYRVPGEPSLPLLEVPITTVPLALAGDTRPGVLRNVSPSFRSELFRRAVRLLPEDAVLICHPYELLPRAGTHHALAFDGAAFCANMEWLGDSGRSFGTIGEVAAAHAGSVPLPMSDTST
jgi:hypothetical protein